MSALPVPLDVENARLPARYIEAKVALAECAQIDVCKDWADKAEALASYARQANDEQLQKYAMRIQARAIERCGELLEEIPLAHGANQNIREGDLPKVTRKDAATQAGLSEHQRKTALRLANVPKDQFEAAVESDNPPTVTALAERGKQARPSKPLIDLGERTPQEFEAATQLISVVDYFLRDAQKIDFALALRGCRMEERATLKSRITQLSVWADMALEALGGDNAV